MVQELKRERFVGVESIERLLGQARAPVEPPPILVKEEEKR